MKPILLFLFFITHQYIGSCQENKYSYDKAIKRITANTWWYYKLCEDDSCHLIDDSTYFYATINDYSFNSKQLSKFNTQKHIQCIDPMVSINIKDPIDNSFITKIVFDAIPNFCFIDSGATDNTYQIFTWGEDGLYKAEMIFASDNEFYIRRIDTFNNKRTVQKFYYKWRGLK